MIYQLLLDISHHQGKIEWAKITNTVTLPNGLQPRPASGIFIKATEGTGYTDPKFFEYASGALKSGIKAGYYHFTRPSGEVGDAKKEAQYFIDTLKKAPFPELGVALDLEDNNKNLSRKDYTNWVYDFISIIKDNGISKIYIYGSPGQLNFWLDDNHGLGIYPLWLAQYGVKENKVKMIKGWSDWTIWQFTDGVVLPVKHPAFKTPVDMNFAKYLI